MNCYFEFDKKKVFCLAKKASAIFHLQTTERMSNYGFYKANGEVRFASIDLLKLVIWIANLKWLFTFYVFGYL